MIINKITEKRLFTLLRLALWRSDEDTGIFDGITEAEWSEIYAVALAQGVLAVAFDGALMLPEEMQPDLDNKIQWGYNVEHIEKIYTRQIDTASKLTRLFADNGIRTMIMKGISVARYYPAPSHRQFGDIDVYLMGDYAKGNEIIAAKGIAIKYEYFVHSEFRFNGVNVENHELFVNADVNETGAYVQRELSRLAGDVRPHPSVEGAFVPSPEFDALFLTRHATWHYARECIRLRDLCDWALFLHHEADGVDKSEVIRMLRESGLERYASIITSICRKYLGLDKTLPFAAEYGELSERVKNDIMTFENPDKFKDIGFFRVICRKLQNRINRKWCYDLVVPDSYYGNILYSIKNYLTAPLGIFKAKL